MGISGHRARARQGGESMFSRKQKKDERVVYLPPYPEELQRDIFGNRDYEKVVSAAKAIIEKYYKPGRHHIGAAVCTSVGKIFAAVNLEATIGRIAVCAETIAIGMACAAGENNITVVAAFSGHDSQVAPPCGMCRELIYDYAPQSEIIIPYLHVPSVPSSMALYRVPISELLPIRYTR